MSTNKYTTHLINIYKALKILTRQHPRTRTPNPTYTDLGQPAPISLACTFILHCLVY